MAMLFRIIDKAPNSFLVLPQNMVFGTVILGQKSVPKLNAKPRCQNERSELSFGIACEQEKRTEKF
jgi:hypothetical protein